jgi:hypothetical protein
LLRYYLFIKTSQSEQNFRILLFLVGGFVFGYERFRINVFGVVKTVGRLRTLQKLALAQEIYRIVTGLRFFFFATFSMFLVTVTEQYFR